MTESIAQQMSSAALVGQHFVMPRSAAHQISTSTWQGRTKPWDSEYQAEANFGHFCKSDFKMTFGCCFDAGKK